MSMGWLILPLYLGDELVSALTPFSSGVFALALVLMHVGSGIRSQSLPLTIIGGSLLATVSGTIGAALSQTPLSAFSLMTIALMTGVWLCGRGATIERLPLLSPRAALVGTGVSVAALLLSAMGWDAFSKVSGIASNRGAGLFTEPSHLTLYVMPLWVIAFQVRRYRPWLCGGLLIIAGASFSASLVIFLMMTGGLGVFASLARPGVGTRWRRRLLASLLLASVALLSLPIAVGESTISSYLGDRIRGLLPNDDVGSENLSSLVVLQGIELAYLSSEASYGLGVGLGNLGLSRSIVEQSTYRDLIGTVTSSDIDLNLRDGGTLAAKLVGELGVLSLLLPWILIRALLRLRAMPPGSAKTYGLAMLTTLLCLLFARALPYFAAPTCLAVMTLAFLSGGFATRQRRRPPAAPVHPSSLNPKLP